MDNTVSWFASETSCTSTDAGLTELMPTHSFADRVDAIKIERRTSVEFFFTGNGFGYGVKGK
jgi:hypothetical protein